MELKDARLFRQQAYIDGQWVEADSADTIEVTNPADGSRLGTVPKNDAAETRRAIRSAEVALPRWRGKTGKERATILQRWFELVMANQEDLALIMTAEQGRVLTEARGEIAYGASFIQWFAEEAKRVYGDVISHPLPGRRILVLKEPVGVVAAITPWNFPTAMITRKCAPALAAGCTVVTKPARETPYSALALAELAERAGVPQGVFNVITGASDEIGGELTASPSVRKVAFTGSTEVGKLLMQQSASTVKKISLELGGNAPFIVFDDADLDAAVAGAMLCKYRNTGQTCVCANRILVQEDIYETFATRLAEAASQLKVGPGLVAETQQGPLINQAALQKVEELVEDAVERGARVAVGGRRHVLGGTFFEPTVLVDVTTRMRVANEEIFGPVAPLLRFGTEEEAIRIANDTPYGLAAYFYSRDIGRIWRVSEALEYGVLGVNEGIISNEVAPFGGMKESGIGREGSKYGIDEFVELKYVCLGGIAA